MLNRILVTLSISMATLLANTSHVVADGGASAAVAAYVVQEAVSFGSQLASGWTLDHQHVDPGTGQFQLIWKNRIVNGIIVTPCKITVSGNFSNGTVNVKGEGSTVAVILARTMEKSFKDMARQFRALWQGNGGGGNRGGGNVPPGGYVNGAYDANGLQVRYFYATFSGNFTLANVQAAVRTGIDNVQRNNQTLQISRVAAEIAGRQNQHVVVGLVASDGKSHWTAIRYLGGGKCEYSVNGDNLVTQTGWVVQDVRLSNGSVVRYQFCDSNRGTLAWAAKHFERD